MALPKKGRYRHFKGGEYELLWIARHSETDEPMVVYRPLYPCGETPNGDRVWVRPLSMWEDEIERDDYRGKRFTRVEEDDPTAAPPLPDSIFAAPPEDAWPPEGGIVPAPVPVPPRRAEQTAAPGLWAKHLPPAKKTRSRMESTRPLGWA